MSFTYPRGGRKYIFLSTTKPGDNTLGSDRLSVCLSVSLFVLSWLNHLTFDLDFW